MQMGKLQVLMRFLKILKKKLIIKAKIGCLNKSRLGIRNAITRNYNNI